ncbi:MAG: DUF5615 family PIN-like protein, partial [Chloroflexota bacterium]
VDQLRKKGVDILHCGEVGMSDADDSEHLLYAVQDKRVMVTCDADFEPTMPNGKLPDGRTVELSTFA